MNKLKRSEFLKFGFLALASGTMNREASAHGSIPGDKISRVRIPMIHATDLYHIHCDPDDHWDLATVYALAYSGMWICLES